MSDLPYARAQPYRIWTSAVGDREKHPNVDVQGPAKFRLPRSSKVASAGSCFAAAIATRLPQLGIEYFVVEPNDMRLSARYGNVYTATQLMQLFERAFGRFDPLERAWQMPGGRFLDPFRPGAISKGFATVEELEEDRTAHLEAVRRVFCECDVFVFTLGLTEAWRDARDGAVFPVPPGRGRGLFDKKIHTFTNYDVEQTCRALREFVTALAANNPTVRVIFTVSPVPLAATMEPMHVARASLYSKSVLKVAAETVAREFAHVDYFASYDTIVYNFAESRIFEADRRHVEPSVADAISVSFVRSFFEPDGAVWPAQNEGLAVESSDECDEDVLLRALGRERRESTHDGAGPIDNDALANLQPIYFAGDSTSIAYRDIVFRPSGSIAPYIAHGLFAPGLHASELSDREGRINSLLMAELGRALVFEPLGPGRFVDRVDDVDDEESETTSARKPCVVLCCGLFDVLQLMRTLDNLPIAFPPDFNGATLPNSVARASDVPLSVAREAAKDIVEPFERGLRVLQSYGVEVIVHSIPPPTPDEGWYRRRRELHGVRERYSTTIALNEFLRDAAERCGAAFLDLWPHVTLANGFRDERYRLDANHLNRAASLVALRLLLEAPVANVA